ncbi:hypothetical protein BCV72DRAFT_309569 [Rhizopus microsporus var. microsporus]|uniref:Uncharacterized protein n=1 Tax=Rhizopus microsporus var. microsporus TaxID=86635 RepID=A0A1X0QQE8_RHIZD|nr:hypothetical protein BCV72DRAFT_309569 [Rhizopus microsporus var. microsporus]
MDDDEIKHRIRQDIFLPAQTFKQAISQQPIDLEQIPQEPIYMEALNTLRPVFDAYDRGYNFGEQGLYYDIKHNPVNHFKAFYQLFRLFVFLGLPVFNCFSLGRSWSPCYVTIDSKILCQNILGIRWSNAVDKLDYWRRVVNLDSKALKPQEGRQLRFRGTIQTDGVGVTVLKKRFDRQTRYTARFTVEYEATFYIINLTRRNYQEISGRCVAVDPGRRDMLYFVHENSTPEQPVQFQYTKQQQEKTWKTKKYRRILQDLKAQNPDVPSSIVSVEEFGRFLQARSEQSAVLSRFYGHTITSHDNGYSLFSKVRLSVCFNKQRADQKLIQDLRAKFREDAVLVMENWSAPMLVAMNLSTSTRPVGTVQHATTKASTRSVVFQIHDCINESDILRLPAMAAPDRYRLWNRDVAACLNYIHILRGFRRNGMVPHRFRRVAVAPTKRRRRVDDQEQPRTRIRLDDDSPS